MFIAAPPIAEIGYGTGAIFELSDLTYSDQIITGVAIDPATDVPGFDISRVSFDNENVFINMGGLAQNNTYTFVGGQKVLVSAQEISLDFTFSGDPTPIVPEPKMFWLLLLSGAIFLGARRYV